MVQWHIVETLNYIVRSPVRSYLTDETAWAVVEACYNILNHSGMLHPHADILALRCRVFFVLFLLLSFIAVVYSNRLFRSCQGEA